MYIYENKTYDILVYNLFQDLPEKSRAVLGDVENLTEERIEMVVKDYFKDYEEGEIANRGWCPHSSAYKVSKAVINAYTRILAKRYPKFCVNCVCPGFVKTDINFLLAYYLLKKVLKVL